MICDMKFISLLIALCVRLSVGFEPVSVGIAAAALSASLGGYLGFTCKFHECCNDAWIVKNFTKLELSLQEHLFGQHLAHDIVVRALKAHFRGKPKKALALSFHGWSGSGKTYVSQFITESIFVNGAKSKYAHFFTGRTHFNMAKEADIYKMHLGDWIRGNVSSCGTSLFVFDEVDKMPKGVLDSVKPFLDYHDNIDGIDFRNSIFIFLSNTGSNLIVQKLIELWENGINRNDINLNDFEQLIMKGAFNEPGGFHESETIESNLIDHYVPFLPLEQKHIKECIKAEFRQRGISPNNDYIEEVLSDLPFGPAPHNLFSNSGCKRISSKTAAIVERHLYHM